MTSSPKRHNSLSRKKTDREVGNFHLASKSMQLKSCSLGEAY
jgi:hypothetical protein